MDKYINFISLNNYKPAFLVFAALLFCNVTLAQDEKEVDNVFDVYSKLGLIVGLDNLYTTNEPNSVSYELSTSKAFVIGLEYNFYQFKNYNLKVSALYREYNLKNYTYFKGEDFGLDFDISGVLSYGPWSQIKVPIEIQYFKDINDELFVYFGFGPEFIIYPDDPSSGSALGVLEDGTEVGFTEIGYNNDKSFYFGFNGAIGFGYKTKYFLIRPFLQYHYQPEDLYTIIVTTQNLQSSPNTVSKHTIKGSYLSFGVVLNPAKSLFKKSKG